jgi:hypothetical protein
MNMKICKIMTMALFFWCSLASCDQKIAPSLNGTEEIETNVIGHNSTGITCTPSIIIDAETITYDAVDINAEIEIGKQKAGIIIVAIQRYYQNNNTYPSSLNDLVPCYINKVPITITGRPFNYMLSEPNIYILIFSLSTSTDNATSYCAYLRKQDTWECGWERLP